MTVAELVKILSTEPQDAQVLVMGEAELVLKGERRHELHTRSGLLPVATVIRTSFYRMGRGYLDFQPARIEDGGPPPEECIRLVGQPL
jgi:hypothetical protein